MVDQKDYRIKRVFVAILVMLGSVMAFYTCTNDDTCVITDVPKVNIGFYQLIDNVETDTILQFFSADGLIDNDSNLYDSVNVSTISLPLSPLDDSCSFLFRYSQVDTSWPIDTSYVIDSITDPLDWDTTEMEIDTLMEFDTIYYSDKVTFMYERKLNMISEECGFQYLFYLNKVLTTDSLISSKQIIQSEIETFDDENLKIFFKHTASCAHCKRD